MTHKIGFLGFGSMAQAICKGALSSGILRSEFVYFTQRNTEKGNQAVSELGITMCTTEDLVQTVDILVLGIKPQQLSDALSSVSPLSSSLTVVSLLAGTSLSTLSSYCETDTGIVRTMPNTPALIQKGVTALCSNSFVKPDHLATIQSIFSSVGTALFVDESDMDSVTALSGSGPAFVYAIARDIAQAGVSLGLSEDTAHHLVSETLIGAGEMLKLRSKSPNDLIADVASPGGTTEAGLLAYSQQDITSRLNAVIVAAATRSAELRKEKES